MNFHSAGKNKFIVELTQKDMLELDITYEEMDYSKIETRRVIWTIIQKIRDNLGRDIDPSGNLLIEASADSHGGCVLSFTVSEKRGGIDRHALKLTKAVENPVYEFRNENDLLDMMSVTEGAELVKCNRLFRSGEKFRIILSSTPSGEEKRILEEYAIPVSKELLAACFTYEHWQRA